ncbi:unnamed protein product [Natator depressus]
MPLVPAPWTRLAVVFAGSDYGVCVCCLFVYLGGLHRAGRNALPSPRCVCKLEVRLHNEPHALSFKGAAPPPSQAWLSSHSSGMGREAKWELVLQSHLCPGDKRPPHTGSPAQVADTCASHTCLGTLEWLPTQAVSDVLKTGVSALS